MNHTDLDVCRLINLDVSSSEGNISRADAATGQAHCLMLMLLSCSRGTRKRPFQDGALCLPSLESTSIRSSQSAFTVNLALQAELVLCTGTAIRLAIVV